ncbi:hypothetical protein CJ030_MR0G025662 [Morella rubra]|uniref:Retrovirus-related Pol polyprotein from transposon TNT 1-94-like beta-barrel domain-containing protein n=1 Tax=Morella rubra TaxID=262757 RepID=A0A6A1UGF6_9ROSI|nr:hypothetical protein CJ030_MR0G025662 [Morella rubra]
MFCTKCKRDNHMVETCFEVHGYPPGYRVAKGRQGYNNNNITLGNASGAVNQVTSSGDSSSTTSSQLPISQEQYQQLLSFLQCQKIAQPASPSANQVSTSQSFTLAPMSGIISSLCFSAESSPHATHSVFYNHPSAHQVSSTAWILDSGATNHMISDKSLFTTSRPLINSFVRLPDG